MDNIVSWIAGNWIEVLAALVSFTYVILAIKQIIWLWGFGILSAILYAWVYGHSGFYAVMALQVYYAIICIYGWVHWSVKARGPNSENVLPVIRLKRGLFFKIIASWLLLWIIIGFALHNFTNSTIPFWDALTASGGIVATWMIARKILEQWLFWIVIDIASVGLYLWQGLYITTILYAVYIITAIIGYKQWRKAWLATV